MNKPTCFGRPARFDCNKDKCANFTLQLCISWSREVREQRYFEEWKKGKNETLDEDHYYRCR